MANILHSDTFLRLSQAKIQQHCYNCITLYRCMEIMMLIAPFGFEQINAEQVFYISFELSLINKVQIIYTNDSYKNKNLNQNVFIYGKRCTAMKLIYG